MGHDARLGRKSFAYAVRLLVSALIEAVLLPSSAVAIRPAIASDARRSGSTTGTAACICMPSIVQSHARHASALCNRIPWAFEIVAWLLRITARYHLRADTLQPVQHGKGRSIEDHSLAAALAVGQEKTAALHIDMLPP